MDVDGSFPAEGVVKHVILGRGSQILRSPHHTGYIHEMIVDNVCEIIGGHTVGFYENLIFHFGIVYGDLAENKVDIGVFAVRCGNILPDNIALAVGEATFHFFARKGKTMFVVFAGSVFIGQTFKPFLGTETVIRRSFLHKLLGVLKVSCFALTLYIRTVLAAHQRTFVPHQTRFAQGVVDDLFGAFHIARTIGVFDAEDKFSVILFGVHI